MKKGMKKEAARGEKSLSRRDFMKGAAASAASVAAIGLLGACTNNDGDPAPTVTQAGSVEATTTARSTEPDVPVTSAAETTASGAAGEAAASSDWLGVAPGIKDEDCSETITAEIIIVGAGVSGLSVARAAAENGAEVLVLEQSETHQCRGLCFGAIDAGIQKEVGVVFDRQLILNDWMQYSGNRANASLVRKWIEESGSAYDWFEEPLKETGVDYGQRVSHWPNPDNFDNSKEYYRQYNTSIEFVDWVGAVGVQYEKTVELGVTYLFETAGKELIIENGSVTGVYAEKADGTLIKAEASKGVVLCTGDYGANEDMLKALCQEFYLALGKKATSIVTSTGYGHKMAIWAGAVMEPQPHAHMSHAFAGGFFGLGNTAALQLNAKGRRYMNEDIPGQSFTNQVLRQPGSISYQIWAEGSLRDQLNNQSIGHGNKEWNRIDDESFAAMIEGFRKELDPDTASGYMYAAETLEELVEKLGLPAETAIAEITRYNELCEKGEDEDFAKRADRMYAVKEGPFYAAPAFIAAGVMTAGVMVDEDLQVVDSNLDKIVGLYAVGNVAGGRYAIDYPTNCPATSHGTAITFGKSVGEALAGK